MSSPVSKLPARADVLVLGGGITGAACARELALLGYSVVLVERRCLAWGASGRSSRLIHGGLRYLAAGQLGLVRRSLAARRELVMLAPHVVRPCPFVVPLCSRDPWRWRAGVRAGVTLYDLLSRPRRGWPAPRRIGAEEARAMLPGLDAGGFDGAVVYHDGLTDDRRLTTLLALDAANAGAVLATRCEVEELRATEPGVAVAHVRDTLEEERRELEVRAVVNATGAWVDTVRGRHSAGEVKPVMRPARGAHLVVSGRLPAAALLRHPRDGRVVFLIPAGEQFMVGTTDDDDACPPDEVGAHECDEDYLRELLADALPGHEGEVRAAFAGLRPLVRRRGTSDAVSRREELVCERVEGLPFLSLVGGKLTLAVPMARVATRRLAKELKPRRVGAKAIRRLPGGQANGAGQAAEEAVAAGLTARQANWLTRRYGSDWRAVVATAAAPLAGAEEIPLAGEVSWAFRQERARSVSDLLYSWRLPEVVAHESVEPVARAALAVARELLGWNDARADREWRLWQEERDLVYGPSTAEARDP